MKIIPGYQIFEKIYESSESLIYRGSRDSDQQPVVLKVLKPEYPAPEAIARLQSEYVIAHHLDLEGVIHVHSLETYQHRLILVMESGGASLDRGLPTPTLEAFLPLAIQVTQIVGAIHQQGITHRDINPANLVRHPTTGQVKLIDFSSATSQDWSLPDAQGLEGTLAYMSPEQTGRMNRAMDYRTDFYSLGVTFYQWLCDRLPFETTDVMELVHCHIAKQPPPPSTWNPQIPQAVSQIVMKLLAKNADDRYQSARGIQTDLQTCLNQLNSSGQILLFPLAQSDLGDRLQVPQKLYGRDQEVEALLAAFDRVTAEQSELMLISGDSGLGKSALVQESRKRLLHRNGYFISGKFESLQSHTPTCLIQALRALIQQILSETQLALWREKLLKALGRNGQVMVDIMPELELIIGQQPAVPELPSRESRHRFNLVLQNFIWVFAQPEHPLVIFLDDLQWADRSSLNLIQVLMTAPHRQHLLLIGAYREQEVDATHPLSHWVDHLRAAGARVSAMALPPLAVPAVNQWLADTLHSEPSKVQPLAELVGQKAHGNPLLIGEFLQSLHQAKLIHLESDGWQWNLQQIQATQFTDDFHQLITDKIQKLSDSTQRLLAFAACMGRQFYAGFLSLLLAVAQSEVVTTLWEAVQAGLISLVEEADALPPADAPDRSDVVLSYQFLHARIHQVVYSLIPPMGKSQMHAQIGRWLLQETSASTLEDKIFEMVNHLNLGTESITPAEKEELIQLNWLAGHKAKAAIAYESALTYFNAGLALLDHTSWSSAYELTLNLHGAAAEAAYLSGDCDQMAQLITVVLQQAKTPRDRLKAYQVQIQAGIAQNQYTEAIATALDALKLLDIKLPASPRAWDVLWAAMQTKIGLLGKSIADLLNLPPMTDPDKLAALQIISSVCTPTYFRTPRLWQLMVFQKVQLSLKYGNAPGSAFGFADYGMVLSAAGNVEAGYEFAQLASALLPKLNSKEFTPKTLLLINIYLRHWREHLRTTLPALWEAYQAGLETGDLEYAIFSLAFRACHAYWLGRDLCQLEQEMATQQEAIAQFKQTIPLYLNQVYRQSVLNLLGQSEHPCRLIGQSYNEAESLPLHQAAQDRYMLFQVHLNKLILCYLFQNYSEAIEQATLAEQLLAAGATGLLVVPVFYFYSCLAHLALFPDVPPAEQRRILSKVLKHQKKMKRWAAHAPMNYAHKYYLVEAERHRVLGETALAIAEYDRAISLANAHEYIHEEALANEKAAQFYLKSDRIRVGQVYLQAARYCYARWGATAKVKALETQYPQLLEATTARQTAPHSGGNTLDLAAVLQAAQILSGEIVLEQLLAKLMKILIENAGAETGYLILETQGQWQIEAEGTASAAIAVSIPLNEDSARLPTAVINYVARTRESMVLNDATQADQFSHDPYMVQYQPKSLLCTPLLRQGKLIGMAYLENNLTTNAFTADRLEVVKLLSTQAAISIENARLYDQLEIRVQARTAALTQANQQMAQLTAELRRSNEELEQFAYVASHDLQEPLRSITSYTQKLAQRYQGQLDARADQYMSFVVDGATRMQQLIRDLLAYSRVGRQTLKREAIDCHAIVQKVQRDLQAAIAETQATITVEPLPPLYADATQLALLFQNLLSNALKYRSADPPAIQISALPTPSDSPAAQVATWRFAIRDNGIGIDPQYRDRIFGIFQRLHTNDEYPGTGLGLAISKKIVENHGGRLWVEPQAGNGSTFCFELSGAEDEGDGIRA